MTRRQLFRELLTRWAAELLVQGKVDSPFRDDINDNLGLDDFHEVITQIKTVSTDNVSLLLLQQMDSLQTTEEALNEDIVTSFGFLQAEVMQHRLYCYKEFSYSSVNGDLSIITSSKIRQLGAEGNISDADWKILELIFLTNYNTAGFITGFLDDAQHNDMVYVLTNLPETDVWRLYAYGYFCCVNKEPVAIPSDLNYSSSIKFAPSILFRSNVKYEQYFDAYHVMNESKHVNDLLNRYLRMFQILELFVYRSILADLVTANSRNSAFVRNVIKSTIKSGDGEKKQFIEGFAKVFSGIEGVITQVDISPYNVFLDSTYLIKAGTQHSANKIGTIIYALRNSVVHNKESELHFTFGNVSEYQSGIGLIKLIVEKMEKEIVEKMNMAGSPIEYPTESMPLY